MGCKDPWIAGLIQDLILNDKKEQNISIIMKKHELSLIETDPFFYYKLGLQYQKERKFKPALDILSIYEKSF